MEVMSLVASVAYTEPELLGIERVSRWTAGIEAIADFMQQRSPMRGSSSRLVLWECSVRKPVHSPIAMRTQSGLPSTKPPQTVDGWHPKQHEMRDSPSICTAPGPERSSGGLRARPNAIRNLLIY